MKGFANIHHGFQVALVQVDSLWEYHHWRMVGRLCGSVGELLGEQSLRGSQTTDHYLQLVVNAIGLSFLSPLSSNYRLDLIILVGFCDGLRTCEGLCQYTSWASSCIGASGLSLGVWEYHHWRMVGRLCGSVGELLGEQSLRGSQTTHHYLQLVVYAELELADGLALGESLGEELGLAEGGALGEELGEADGLAKGKVLKEELIWSYAPPFLLEHWFWPLCYTLLYPKLTLIRQLSVG